MQVTAGFIVGFDNDSESTFDAQVRFIQQVGIVTAMVGILMAMPQTRLWKRLQAENRLLGDTDGNNTVGSLNFIPKMDPKVLVDGYRRIIERIYSRRLYYRRINTFLKNYTPTAKAKVTRQDLQAAVKSVVRIGLFSKASPYYWKLVIPNLFRPRYLPVVFELIICGEHYTLMRKRLLAMQAC
jgi:radical SAM superfamily enzyme YgiQ (UPF0313 family)